MIKRSGLRRFSSLLIAAVIASIGLSGNQSNAKAQRDRVIELPKAQHASVDNEDLNNDSVIVTITSAGEYYIGKEKIKKEDLRIKFRSLLEDRSPDKQRLYIKSEAQVSFLAVREVMNHLRDVGFDLVGFVVENTEPANESAVFNAQISIPFGIEVALGDRLPPLPPRPRQPQAGPPPPPPPPPPPSSVPRRVIKEVPIAPSISPNSLVVEYQSGTMVAVNTKELPLTSLSDFLSILFDRSIDKSIFIKAPKDRSYGEVIALIDEVKGAGAEFILLLIDEVKAPNEIVRNTHPPGIEGSGLPGGIPGGVPGGVPEEPNVIRKSGGVLARSAIKRVEAKTPPLAKAAQVTGPVVVEVYVDEDGNVEAARALSGHPLLKDAAVSAAREWKFTPTKVRGKLVKVVGTITFTFK